MILKNWLLIISFIIAHRMLCMEDIEIGKAKTEEQMYTQALQDKLQVPVQSEMLSFLKKNYNEKYEELKSKITKKAATNKSLKELYALLAEGQNRFIEELQKSSKQTKEIADRQSRNTRKALIVSAVACGVAGSSLFFNILQATDVV